MKKLDIQRSGKLLLYFVQRNGLQNRRENLKNVGWTYISNYTLKNRREKV
jgi:hypothetical protein